MKLSQSLLLSGLLAAPLNAEARESCNSVACAETVKKYNDALCKTARLYRYQAEADYVARAEEVNIKNAEDHSLNWTPFFNELCPDPAIDRADQEKLKLDLVLLNERVVERRDGIIRDEVFSDGLEGKVRESNKYALLVAKEIKGTSILIPPKIEEIKQSDIQQWKLKTAWEAIPMSGDAYSTWIRKFKVLDLEMKRLDAILNSSAPAEEKADATSAMLLAIELMSNLGMAPEIEENHTPTTNKSTADDKEDMLSFGPALVVDRTVKREEPKMEHIKGPDLTIGVKDWGFDVQFWRTLNAHMQDQVLSVFKWNQEAYLSNPSRRKFKSIDPNEAYENALELTVRDLSNYPGFIHLSDNMEDIDLDVGCRNPAKLKLEGTSDGYLEAYKQYREVCMEFDFNKDTYRKVEGDNDAFRINFLYYRQNTENFGTKEDPRFSFFEVVSE